MTRLMKYCATFVVACIAFAASLPASAQNYTGSWWNQSQSGMGLFLLHQGKTVFAPWFHYDEQRRPTFLVFVGPLQKDSQNRDSYSGPLYKSYGPQPARYDPAQAQLGISVGTVSIVWNSTTSATMTYNFDGSGATQAGTLNLYPFELVCTPPTAWSITVNACVAPMGAKVIGAKQLPPGCNTWRDQCWKDAVANGTVKFVATSAKMTGYNDRPVMFAFFRNTSTAFGVTGLWNYLPFYADDSSTFTDIFGGTSDEIDWAYGTERGIITHSKQSGLCVELAWNASERSWDVNGTGVGTPVPCP